MRSPLVLLVILQQVILLLCCYSQTKASSTLNHTAKSQWNNCPGKSTESVRIFYFEVYPSPIRKGSVCRVGFVATTDKLIEGGNVTILIQYGYDIIHVEKTLDLCDLFATNNIRCPLKPSIVTLDMKLSIPFKLPTGTYRGKIVVTDLYDRELLCMGLNLPVDL